MKSWKHMIGSKLIQDVTKHSKFYNWLFEDWFLGFCLMKGLKIGYFLLQKMERQKSWRYDTKSLETYDRQKIILRCEEKNPKSNNFHFVDWVVKFLTGETLKIGFFQLKKNMRKRESEKLQKWHGMLGNLW